MNCKHENCRITRNRKLTEEYTFRDGLLVLKDTKEEKDPTFFLSCRDCGIQRRFQTASAPKWAMDLLAQARLDEPKDDAVREIMRREPLPWKDPVGVLLRIRDALENGQ